MIYPICEHATSSDVEAWDYEAGRCVKVGTVLEPQQLVQAHACWIADRGARLSGDDEPPDVRDHVSEQRGPATWDMVWGWIEARSKGAESGAGWLGHPR